MLLEPTSSSEPVVDICNRAVMGHCEEEIKEEREDCSDESELRAFFANRLANPLEGKVCKQSQLALGERCPRGCVIDYATVVVIPGKLQFDLFPMEEKPKCRVRARRSLSMQGRCVAEAAAR